MTSLAPREPGHRPPSRTGAAGRGPSGPAGRRPAPERPPGRADAEAERLRRLAAGFAQAFLEVECGRRPRVQLRPILCPRLDERLAAIWVRPGPVGHLVRTHGARVGAQRYEAVAVVRREQRVGAIVISLARQGTNWRVVDAARPEDGTSPCRPLPGRPPSA